MLLVLLLVLNALRCTVVVDPRIADLFKRQNLQARFKTIIQCHYWFIKMDDCNPLFVFCRVLAVMMATLAVPDLP